MVRRSSARLRNRNSTTPQRVSLSHDAPTTTRTPRTVPTKLISVEENDEIPGAFPPSVSPSSVLMPKPTIPENLAEKQEALATPTKSRPIQPSEHEMHPQLHHQSTAKPREEARHLGFSNMPPHSEPPKSKMAALQDTPTRAQDAETRVKSPRFQFTFRREHSLELSPEAKKLMYEKREEAARIREQMIADGEGAQSVDEVMAAREIAVPKGRFSQVHLKEFEKMDSIAGHASSFRAKQSSRQGTAQKDAPTATSLKRTLSKADLVQQNSDSSRLSSRDSAKLLPPLPGRQLPRSTSLKDLKHIPNKQPASPAKRVKRVETDDVSSGRLASEQSDKLLPSTPGKLPNYPDLSHLTTPTQASLARASSVKSAKITKIPAPSLTSAKVDAKFVPTQPTAKVPALLARSPSKASFPRSHKNYSEATNCSEYTTAPMLARSPMKAGTAQKTMGNCEATSPAVKPPQFLSRSPLKALHAKRMGPEAAEERVAAVPFLARSPSKLPVVNPAGEGSETPGKSTSSKLLDRFNLLRRSPMKSILRAPQRLYSDDPAKVAAGTHLATPPKVTMTPRKAQATEVSVPTTTAKHVDFSSSTKARHEKGDSTTPSKTPSTPPQAEHRHNAFLEPETVSYPDLDLSPALLSPSPQKRRQTSGPRDFTFRAGDQGIIFGSSPKAAASGSQRKRPSTIRMVSTDLDLPAAPVTGSKKRKLEFENNVAVTSEDVDMMSEKENTPVQADVEELEERPSKRAKPMSANTRGKSPAATASTVASAARLTTLGVKPKGAKPASPVKRPSTISQARLAALSQPKRRE